MNSKFIPNQVVRLKFRKKDTPIIATVRGVHLYPFGYPNTDEEKEKYREKYDLGLWLGDGSVDDPERETRIYNVDSEFVSVS